MHRCLEIVDVLRIIFMFVFEDYGGSQDVAALASTCQGFQCPACDILWHTLPTLYPLVTCLPVDAWELNNRTVTLQRVTTSEEWAVCKPYASRIRRLGFASYHPLNGLEVDPSVLHALSLNPAVTFQNLQEFRGDQGEFPYVGLFLGPALSCIHLTLPTENTTLFAVSSLLDSFKAKASNLKEVRLFQDYGSDPINIGPIFPGLVEGLKHLKVLECSRWILPHTALRILAASSTLCALSAANTAEDIVSCLPERQLPFQYLEQLMVTTSHLIQCSELFVRMHPRRLQSLYVSTTYTPTTSEIHDFLRILQTHCCHTYLSSFNFQQTHDTTGASNHHVMTPNTVSPLLSFKNLEHLNLDFFCASQLDDTSFETMTTAWPKMTCFQYGSHAKSSWEDDSFMSFDGLISIAKHWPKAYYVRLPCNPQSTRSPRHRPGGGSICGRLLILEIRSSVFSESAAEVAAFLTDLFPGLESVTSPTSEYKTKWREVKRLLPVFHDVRSQERTWFATERGGAPAVAEVDGRSPA